MPGQPEVEYNLYLMEEPATRACHRRAVSTSEKGILSLIRWAYPINPATPGFFMTTGWKEFASQTYPKE